MKHFVVPRQIFKERKSAGRFLGRKGRKSRAAQPVLRDSVPHCFYYSHLLCQYRYTSEGAHIPYLFSIGICDAQTIFEAWRRRTRVKTNSPSVEKRSG